MKKDKKTKEKDVRKFISATLLQRKFKHTYEFCQPIADFINKRFEEEGYVINDHEQLQERSAENN